jgi:hypothetical protein
LSVKAVTSANPSLPSLPFDDWADTCDTLHLFFQIVGKIRLRLMPPRNHWWHVPLYVSARGATTGPIPWRLGSFEIEFDLVSHELVIRTDDGRTRTIPLPGLSVAAFYERVLADLHSLGIDVKILATPFGVPHLTEPFATDTRHNAYDRDFVASYHHVLVAVDGWLKTFSGRFTGKTSPVHLFWHSFDLAVTRFSGRRAPAMPAADRVTQEAYSHEVVSFGFWPGDPTFRQPAFYSYTAPEPAGLSSTPLSPSDARWEARNGSSLAVLPYDAVRAAERPGDAVLGFLESAYRAGARLANWDVDALTARLAR